VTQTSFSEVDRAMMQRALALAERGLWTTTPNPRVGCVIAHAGEVVGEGWHETAGAPHAEVHALGAAGARARGATAYVTLEPCNHHGRTPPCAEALARAGVGRVVAAVRDPHPEAGGGGAALAAAGIRFEHGVLEEAARELNIGFFSRLTRGRPWVRMKIAATLDGRTALADGRSQWITGAAARADGHRWRARACAILTGAGTVRADDPQLTVRDVATARQPLRVVVDSRLETPPQARVLRDGGALVYCAVPAPRELAGAAVVVLPNPRGKVDLPGMLKDLAQRGVNELHVEAGVRLNGSLLREGCVDELLVYLNPSLLGDGAQGMFDLPPFDTLEARPKLALRGVERVGDDLRILARF
jgi:diaminohydroxyphosphoribosylaminopyrimidine deaminase/5-amino-6-(5-phosphoribosylamino)uracil reductase